MDDRATPPSKIAWRAGCANIHSRAGCPGVFIAGGRSNVVQGLRLGGLRVLEQFQALTVFFPPLIDGHDGTAERREAAKLFLDILEPFMPLSMGYLLDGPITLMATILFVLFVNFSDFRPQIHDFFLE